MEFETIPVTRFAQNCSILWSEGSQKAAVIDPGGDLYLVQEFLDIMDLTAEVVLVTHGHFDHAGGAAALAAATGARIEGPHQGDEHLVTRLSELGERYGVRAQSYTPERWLKDGDTVSFGGETIDVLHCPGHTRGHVAYFSASARQAFVGDILFRHAIGAWEHADGDLPLLLDSIRTKLFALGDDVRFVPGHGAHSSFGHERMENPFVGDAAMAAWRARKAAAPPE